MSRPRLRLIEGEGPEMQPLSVHMTHRSLHTVAAEIVEAAQAWTSYMIGSNALDTIDVSTEYGRLTLQLTDRVTEYEARMAVVTLPDMQTGPAATLW